MSFGPAQWNFKSGTLVPLFREFEQADEAALKACFADETDYEEWQRVLSQTTGEQTDPLQQPPRRRRRCCRVRSPR